MKQMRISWINQYADYQECMLVALIRQMLGGRMKVVPPKDCDLLIVGPYSTSLNKSLSSRSMSRAFLAARKWLPSTTGRATMPITLYHSSENSRFDPAIHDFGITSDLGVVNKKHFRLPVWKSLLDWSHEGLNLKPCPRNGDLVKISRLLEPLGCDFMSRPRRAALVCMHLREPRATLFQAVNSLIPVDGYGKAFDEKIPDHNQSGFSKYALLQRYGFCLCPENSLFPGYYTEKIPEAFSAGALPISWCDPNVHVDFNPNAFLNLLPDADEGYQNAIATLLDNKLLGRYADEPLLHLAPKLDPLRVFLERVLEL